MKKILLTIMAVVFVFSLAAPVMGKGLKPPKDLCIDTLEDPFFILGIKKGNKLVLPDGSKLSMYTVQGLYNQVPVSGTGYVNNDDFIFQFSTSADSNALVLGQWDLIEEVGSAKINLTKDTGFTSENYDLYPCGFVQ